MIEFDQIWLAVEPVDMRLGVDGLSSRLQNSLGRAPCDGSVYAFTNRAHTRVKLVVWEGLAYGCVNVACIGGGSFGRGPTLRCLRCCRRSGRGCKPGSNGNGSTR